MVTAERDRDRDGGGAGVEREREREREAPEPSLNSALLCYMPLSCVWLLETPGDSMNEWCPSVVSCPQQPCSLLRLKTMDPLMESIYIIFDLPLSCCFCFSQRRRAGMLTELGWWVGRIIGPLYLLIGLTQRERKPSVSSGQGVVLHLEAGCPWECRLPSSHKN